MKKSKLTKIIACSLIAVSIFALNPIGASAEWKNDDNGWWYTESDSYATGWRNIDSKWYYFDSDGYMAHDTTVDGYKLGSDGAWIQETQASQDTDTVLATVGDEKITKGDLDKAMKNDDAKLKQQYGSDYATNSNLQNEIKEIKKEALVDLVSKKIILQKASELNLKPSDDEINKQINDNINKYNSEHPGQDFASLLQKKGITMDEGKKQLSDAIIVNVVENNVVKDISVTDDEVKDYYDKNKDTKFTIAAGASVAHILVTDEVTAKNLKAKLDAGADFAALAKENSIDTGSKDNGGNLGYIPYNSTAYVTEFMNGFKNLKEGEVSEPVKSQYGYHLIKVTGIKESGAVSFDEVKDKIKAALLNNKQGNAFASKLEEWKNELNVKLYEDKI